MSGQSYNNFFDQIRQNINVSDVVGKQVKLTRKGMEYSGLCPFHTEKTPSFTVNDVKRFYHCFGCGAHGDVVKFVTETAGLSYMQAAKKLAEDYGIAIPIQTTADRELYEESETVLRTLNLANQFFRDGLNKASLDYLSSRGIAKEKVDKYSIGFAQGGNLLQQYLESHKVSLSQMHDAGLIGRNQDGGNYAIFRNRIIFPIKNIYGKVIAFGGRILGEGMPKYLNSPENILFKKSQTLYGEDLATGPAYQKKQIIIVEGYLDVIAMHEAGFTNTVATLGTAITLDHLNKLWKIADELIFCMDGDSAGQNAMKKALFNLLPILNAPRKASFLVLPQGLDPDEVITRFGKEHVEGLIKKRIATSEMIWHLETSNKKFTTPEAKSSLESQLEQYTNLLVNNSLAKHMQREFKNKIWELSRIKKGKEPASTLKYSQDLAKVSNLTEIIEYNLCAILIRNPILIGDPEIYDQFMSIEFKTSVLKDLQSYIIELYSSNSELTHDLVMQNLQKSRFSDLFVLLSSGESSFFDAISLSDDKIEPALLWGLFVKKYQLELLKEEYEEIVYSKREDRFDRAKAYLGEINNLEATIKEFHESLESSRNI